MVTIEIRKLGKSMADAIRSMSISVRYIMHHGKDNIGFKSKPILSLPSNISCMKLERLNMAVNVSSYLKVGSQGKEALQSE